MEQALQAYFMGIGISRHSWDPNGAVSASVAEVAAWILGCEGIEGVTFSGGEPMEQAAALCTLVDRIRRERDLGVLCYTGYTLERLQRSGSPPQRDLLAKLDLLIDGPYREDLHADLLWRGSANQRLRALSARYADFVSGLAAATDRSCGLDFHITSDGVPSFVGVPPRPGFAAQFEASLRARGMLLDRVDEGVH